MKLKRIDHIGIVVKDLEAAKDFFVTLGMELQCEADVGGELVDRIIGLDGTRSSIAVLQTPDGDTNVELVKYHRPLPTDAADKALSEPLPNAPGFRHLAFAVEDLEGIVAALQEKGATLLGEIVSYEGTYKLCHLRGPDGIIIELAEEL